MKEKINNGNCEITRHALKLIRLVEIKKGETKWLLHTLTYSFFRTRPTSRLDRIYISSSQIQNTSHSSYSSITFSDHNKSPNITLKTPSTITFRSSHLKLNDSILNCANNFFSIKTKINHLSTPLNH